jgi:type VI secretion system secreted protein VgrG
MDAKAAHISLSVPAVDTDLQVLAFTGREMLNKPYRFDIELVSQRADLDLDALINQTAYLTFGPSGKGVHGVIYGVTQGDSGIGNRNSHVYHLPQGCPSYNRVTAKNRVPFNSEAEAQAAGYRKAGNCR